MKKVGNITKKIGFLFLTTVMIVTSFPILSHEVYAAELPDSTQFATVEQLKSFNTDDTNDGTKYPAKVYFGNNNQQWWIADSQQEQNHIQQHLIQQT